MISLCKVNYMINYAEWFRSSSKWASFMNNNYMNLTAPKIKIFKLDKKQTVIDPLYHSDDGTRIYLQPFELNAYHLDLRWTQLLGPLPYQESEEPMSFIINFDNMVNEIKKIKDDNDYKNVEDVIEIGDVILTNKYRLYEVTVAMPSGDFLFDFVTWTITSILGRIDKYVLPAPYDKLVEKKQKELGY